MLSWPAAPMITATLPLMRPMVVLSIRSAFDDAALGLRPAQRFGAIPALGGAPHVAIELEQIARALIEFDHVAQFARCVEHGEARAGGGTGLESDFRAGRAGPFERFGQGRHEMSDMMHADFIGRVEIPQNRR